MSAAVLKSTPYVLHGTNTKDDREAPFGNKGAPAVTRSWGGIREIIGVKNLDLQ